jgi:hypothetical protein
MPHFADLLVDTSQTLLACGKQLEQQLERVLVAADKCSPDIALLAADTLSKLVKDIISCPAYFSEKLGSSGKQMRAIVEVLVVVLKSAKPQETRSKHEYHRALAIVDEACRKHDIPAEGKKLFHVLLQEIIRVFYELREILKRMHTRQSKRLFNELQRFARKMHEPILCFAYNSLKMRVCLRSIDECGAKSQVDKSSMHKLVKNIYDLRTHTRAMTVLAPLQRDTMNKAVALAKDSAA